MLQTRTVTMWRKEKNSATARTKVRRSRSRSRNKSEVMKDPAVTMVEMTDGSGSDTHPAATRKDKKTAMTTTMMTLIEVPNRKRPKRSIRSTKNTATKRNIKSTSTGKLIKKLPRKLRSSMEPNMSVQCFIFNTFPMDVLTLKHGRSDMTS